ILQKKIRLMWGVVICAGFIVGCSDNQSAQSPIPTLNALSSDLPTETAVFTPTPQASPTTLPSPTPSPSPVPITVQLDANLPAEILQQLQEGIGSQFQFEEDNADLLVKIGEGEPLGRWVYALVGPFNLLRDGISSAEIQQATLVGTAETAAMWQTAYPQMTIVPENELSSTVWNNPSTFAIVPFHQLTSDLKVLAIDGLSPLKRDLDLDTYPLSVSFGVDGDPSAVVTYLGKVAAITNRDETKMTRVAMTGVTALVRATAAQMEYSGILFPGEVVAPILQAADVAHISNEVPFAENCPFPNAVSQSVVFCSRDSYFQLLEHLGADVIEVTGNHSNDYGTDAMLRSLDKYLSSGMNYYGGGREINDAFQPAYVYDRGNKIAFVGCNSFGPVGAWATDSQPGTAPCGDFSRISQIVSKLSAEGFVVIVTFQYTEIYSYQATAAQKRDYKLLADAGAAAVSGSQSHHPQAFDFHNGAYIHYGLGNLFFDQMFSLGTRQMFIDEYVVYDGRLISVELWTGLIEYYSRPREMTAAEREALLRSVFNASGWGTR
ncbi:MAG: CapA family protein, partial [Chloroflexota bacterium]